MTIAWDTVQGSVLSTLLCSLYLGHLEKVYLQPSLQRKLQGLPVKVSKCLKQAAQPGQLQSGGEASSSAGLTDLAHAAGQSHANGGPASPPGSPVPV